MSHTLNTLAKCQEKSMLKSLLTIRHCFMSIEVFTKTYRITKQCVYTKIEIYDIFEKYPLSTYIDT